MILSRVLVISHLLQNINELRNTIFWNTKRTSLFGFNISNQFIILNFNTSFTIISELVEPTILVVNANFFGDLVVHQSFVCMRVL
jgi:hypothetical protein